MAKVKIVKSFHRYGEATSDKADKNVSGPMENFEAGWVHDVADSDAADWIAKGLAEAVVAGAEAPSEPPSVSPDPAAHS